MNSVDGQNFFCLVENVFWIIVFQLSGIFKEFFLIWKQFFSLPRGKKVYNYFNSKSSNCSVFVKEIVV